MVMSLVTIFAGAKDFADNGTITYDEAVAVVPEVGISDGYADDDFKPANTLIDYTFTKNLPPFLFTVRPRGRPALKFLDALRHCPFYTVCSKAVFRSLTSWRFAPSRSTERGSPFSSTSTLRFVPIFPRFLGYGPLLPALMVLTAIHTLSFPANPFQFIILLQTFGPNFFKASRYCPLYILWGPHSIDSWFAKHRISPLILDVLVAAFFHLRACAYTLSL